jgi:alpha-ketoglutarate-dependent taurine dioxygenase
MSIEIVSTGAALGAEIRGVNLARPIDDETFAAIEQAYNDHGVIFFRDQHITPPQQVAFTRRFAEIQLNIFGERWSVPGGPEIVVLSNVTEDGRPIGARRAGENWHSDMCYVSRPPRGTMLYALEIPELFGLTLGDTEFASTAAAWSACGGTSTGAVGCLTSLRASGPFRQLRRKSIAIRRSPIQSSGSIPILGANASMSCATIAPGSRE